MYILLIGCTGFLGKSLIRYLIINTNHKLFVTIRPKHDFSVQERLQNILTEMRIENGGRITPIHTTYDSDRSIVMGKDERKKIQDKASIIINALADVKFNRPLQKAVLNNTMTSLNWLSFFQKCKTPRKYIYVSSAFVNFHITNNGIIEEKIYEKQMTERTLINILAGKTTSFSPYHNTYLYSKQMAEIMLKKRRRNIPLIIFRPSILSPAVQHPYCGWTAMQSLNYIFFGMATGTIPFWNISKEDIFNNNVNVIPVDIAAKDCALMIKEKKNFTIKHSCFTGNNPYCITYFTLYVYLLEAYRYYKISPISIKDHTYTPFFPFFTKDHNILYTFILVWHYLCNRTLVRKDILHLLKLLKITYKLTSNFNKHLPHFVSKKIIFKRKNREKWFYREYDMSKSYRIFIEKMDYIIKHDCNLMKLF